MTAIVLDTGALIALERGDRAVWAGVKLAASKQRDVLVPATALARAWRGRASQASLARALQSCVVSSFDATARDVGVLCGRARTHDVCDAQVALVTARYAEELWTSDPDDMRRLLAATRTRRLIAIVRC